MKKFVVSLLTIISILSFGAVQQVSANQSVLQQCGLEELPEENPDFSTVNCLLTETALKYDVPPEIVKGVAEEESANWRHFDSNGEAIVTNDGGIGVMQITNKSGFDEERMKNDLLYNIEAGVKILSQMYDRNDLPTINGGERDVLEHWYFAVMAYNGIKPVNSPIYQDTGERNESAYQEEVFDNIDRLSLTETVEIPFDRNDFQYDSQSDENIEFITMHYIVDQPLTDSMYDLKKGFAVEVLTQGTNLRSEPTTSSTSLTSLDKGEKVTITGPYLYEKVDTKKNHFVWYPVRTDDGKQGFLTSGSIAFSFSDVPEGHYAAEEIDYLTDRHFINGLPNGEFGLGNPLTRWQAVLLITRANYTDLDNRPDPGFSDVPKDYPYYEEIAAAVDEGLFKGYSETEFQPNETLTRAEMAVVLQRLYNFQDSDQGNPFTDLTGDWYKDAVNRLYNNGITNGFGKETTFKPNMTVSREQFAVFMARAGSEQFRIDQ